MPLTRRQEQLAIFRELALEARDRDIEASMSRAAARANEYESKASSTAGIVSTWQIPPLPNNNYERVAREGYGGNEVIYACIEELCTSAAEPVLRAYNGKDIVEDHGLIELLKKPNPFMTGHDYIASLILYRSIAGNSYTEIVFNRKAQPQPVELWLQRPDRMTVLPDPNVLVGGYRFKLGSYQHDFAVDEIMHCKTRNPLDHRYGLAPMSVLLERTDTDNFARTFTKSFFFNAGVPQTLLAFKSILDDAERIQVQSRFRRDYNGAGGWHGVMVTEENEVDVKQLGMPLGARGIAYPELDEINEARICMVFGVPPTLIGARLGVKGGSYANRKADNEEFWNNTLVPIYREIESYFNQYLVPFYSDITHVAFDLTTVNAFQTETDVIHARWRNNFTQSVSGFRESRMALGIATDPDDDDLMLVPANMRLMTFKDFKKALPPPIATQTYSGWHDHSANGDILNENGVQNKPDIRPQLPAGSRNGNGNHP